MAKAVKCPEEAVPCCATCENAVPLRGGETFLCRKKGIVDGSGRCRRYSFDLLKYVPPKKQAPVFLPPLSGEEREESGKEE